MTPPVPFGPYLLIERIGHGGMAVVYKAARHGPNGFKKTMVIKAMLAGLSQQPEFVAMFSAEARLMAQLHHPNIVQVHDFGIVDGVSYLAMEYLAGRNLRELSRAVAAIGQRVPVGAALAITRDVGNGLAYAHDFVDVTGQLRQIIHRDVSPANVMVCRDGSVKLLDFGVAKMLGPCDFDMTQTFKGKYAYMAPEQVTQQPIDRRVDVFALGIVLHELLTSKQLFAAASEFETLQRVAAGQVTPPSESNREVPRVLDDIVLKALARDPKERYGSGSELVDALETLDAMAWSRQRLAAWANELFERDGTRTAAAPRAAVEVGIDVDVGVGVDAGDDASAAVVVEPASEPVQMMRGDERTERQVIDESMFLAAVEPPLPAEPSQAPRVAVTRKQAAPPSPTPRLSSQPMMPVEAPRSPRMLVAGTTLMLALAVVGALTVSVSGWQRVGSVDELPPAAIRVAPPAAAPPAVVPTLELDTEPVADDADVDAEADASPPKRTRHHSSRSRSRSSSSSPSATATVSDRDGRLEEGRLVDPFASEK